MLLKMFNKGVLLVLILGGFFGLVFPVLVSLKSDLAVCLGFGGVILSLYLVVRSVVKIVQKEIDHV